MDELFMKEALKEASKALNSNEFPVGCVIVSQNQIIARGKREKSISQIPSEIDHAEINAIRELQKNFPLLPKNKMTIYSTMEPCLMCLSAITLSGFGKIVYAYEDVMGGGCSIDKKNFPLFYQKKFPEIISGVLRIESLNLFKKFFSSPDNIYWKDSQLSKYTLSL
ncbi:MAG: nucleoside deaminase [Desulforegulaceae bacterium]|nr:nucleoside deaminase [Desulforegulaceae bacterium]